MNVNYFLVYFQVIRDNLLFAIIGGFLIVDTILLSIWQGIDPLQMLLMQYSVSTLAKHYRNVKTIWRSIQIKLYKTIPRQIIDICICFQTVNMNTDVTSTHARYACVSVYTPFWIATFYTYKATLLLYGAYLSWSVRAITLPAMNDSACIILSTLTSTFISMLF